jgi:hypothetical protein
MIVHGLAGTGGVLTPLHGCSTFIWSLRAMAKLALKITLFFAIIAGLTP